MCIRAVSGNENGIGSAMGTGTWEGTGDRVEWDSIFQDYRRPILKQKWGIAWLTCSGRENFKFSQKQGDERPRGIM